MYTITLYKLISLYTIIQTALVYEFIFILFYLIYFILKTLCAIANDRLSRHKNNITEHT